MSDTQVQRMMSFIALEAKEKSQELRAKTEHDFTLEKQMLVHNAKLKINEEFARREKDRAIERSVAASKRMGEQKTRQFTEREALVQQLERETLAQLSSVTRDTAKYSTLLEGLIVQGAEKIAEKSAEVVCRREDKPLVASAVSRASARLPGVELVLSDTRFLSDKLAGGVKVTGLGGRIEADNTLDTRAKLALKDLQPVVRYVLFPSARAPVLEKPEPGSHE